jgi:hypothetical protein
LTSSTDLYRILQCPATRPEPPSVPFVKQLEQSGDVGTQQLPRTRSVLDRGGTVRARPTSSVCPDGLVEPQSKTKATRHGDPIRAQLVKAECGTVAVPVGLALKVFQHHASTRHHAKAKKAVGSWPHFSQAAAKSSSSSVEAIP